MCRFASAFCRPCGDVPVRIADLNSHSETASRLGLTDTPVANTWRKWHYLPHGEIHVNVLEQDELTASQVADRLRNR